MKALERRLQEHYVKRRWGWRTLGLVSRTRVQVKRTFFFTTDLRLRRQIRQLDRACGQTWPRLGAPAEPLVSVVVPVFNNWDLTRACLSALSQSTCLGDMEVIVVDDASTDDTERHLREIRGLRVVRNDHNVGFTHSANRGAEAARAPLIFFLNNDALVFPDCIATLLETMRDSRIAAVGARLIYPNGLLAEAGASMPADGRSASIGQGRRATAKRYNQMRDVDYCSAAALIVRAELFAEVGCFDTQFAPGYYEDADLCFSLRSRGFRIIYQPRATVIHAEGMTHGRADRPAIAGAHSKGDQVMNRQRFVSKWRHELEKR